MPQATVNIRMDEELKKEAEVLFSDFGMNMTTAVTIFIKTTVRERRIPFEINSPDPFYSEANMNRLRKSIAQIKSGNVVVKTMKELEAMENE